MSLNQPCTPGGSTWGAARFGPTHGHSWLAAVPCRSEGRSSSQVTALSWVTCRTGRPLCCWSPAKASFQGWSLRSQSKCCKSREGLLRAKPCCTRIQAALELAGSPRELPSLRHLGSLSTQNEEGVMVTWNYPKLFFSSSSGISHFPRSSYLCMTTILTNPLKFIKQWYESYCNYIGSVLTCKAADWPVPQSKAWTAVPCSTNHPVSSAPFMSAHLPALALQASDIRADAVVVPQGLLHCNEGRIQQ